MKHVVTIVNKNDDVVLLRINAKQYGNCLYSTFNSTNIFECDIKTEDISAIFSELMHLADKRTVEGLFPFPPNFKLTTNKGIFLIDPFLSEELLSGLGAYMAEYDLGDLLDTKY